VIKKRKMWGGGGWGGGGVGGWGGWGVVGGGGGMVIGWCGWKFFDSKQGPTVLCSEPYLSHGGGTLEREAPNLKSCQENPLWKPFLEACPTLPFWCRPKRDPENGLSEEELDLGGGFSLGKKGPPSQESESSSTL